MRVPSIAGSRYQRRQDAACGARRSSTTALIAAVAIGVSGFAACSGADDPEPTVDEYVVELEAICVDTTAQLDALPDPPDGITITEFATQASSILTSEAERVRALDVPGDLDDDHRALIGNDEDQAAAWTDLTEAVAGDGTELTEITTLIASLNLGRNDLVTAMGAPACVRQPG
jgi:hypothetical protein